MMIALVVRASSLHICTIIITLLLTTIILLLFCSLNVFVIVFAFTGPSVPGVRSMGPAVSISLLPRAF